jgi:hypothetical protein
MSIGSITNSVLYSLIFNSQTTQITGNTPSTQNTGGKFQQIQSEFQQLGQDLQAGNLSQAQQDYATLSQNFPNAQTQPAQTQPAQTQNNSNPVAQAFNALAQDLQNANLAGAQQDFANIQQDFQQQQPQQDSAPVHHHHHFHGGGDDGGSQQQNEIGQAFNSLAQALQSNNLSGAQSAFATLQQDLQQFGFNGTAGSTNGTASTSTQTSGNTLNVTA